MAVTSSPHALPPQHIWDPKQRVHISCYGRKKGFNHDHRTCPTHQADTEAYEKAHGSKKRAPAGIREAKVEVDKDELSKLMSQGTELAKEIQEIKRNWVPRSDNKNKENNQNEKSLSCFQHCVLPLLLLAVGVGFPAACFWRSKALVLMKYSHSKSLQDSPSQ